MKIEILGDGCSQCRTLKNKVGQALDDMNLRAELVSVMDMERLGDLLPWGLPGIAIDGNVVATGGGLSFTEIKALLRRGTATHH